MKRCAWCIKDNLYINYHDQEWGVPIWDDRKQFEFLILESFQAVLSWYTILSKRENFRKVYNNFDPKKVAKYDDKKVEQLMSNAGIIRNLRKVEASINNAQRFLEIQKEFGSFCNYIWSFVDGEPMVNKWKKLSEIPAKTGLSDSLSKNLKSRGFKFLGSTTVYAHLQAVGLVNDYLTNCFRYKEISSNQKLCGNQL